MRCAGPEGPRSHMSPTRWSTGFNQGVSELELVCFGHHFEFCEVGSRLPENEELLLSGRENEGVSYHFCDRSLLYPVTHREVQQNP